MIRIWMFLFLMLVTNYSSAMTLEYVEYYGNGRVPKKLKMSGEIVVGDYMKLYGFIKNNKPSETFFGLDQLELDSPGGNVEEAMEMAILLKKIYPSIYVNNTCASSCLLLWLSGASRHVEDNGKIGVHRPTFSKDFYKNQSLKETQVSYEKASTEFKAFVLEQGLPLSIYEKLMATSSQIILWLTKEDIELIGNSPAYIDEKLHKMCDEALSQSIKTDSEEDNAAASECIHSITLDAKIAFYDKLFGKSNVDWMTVRSALLPKNASDGSLEPQTTSDADMKAAMDTLSKIHPDWLKVTNTKQFKQWVKGLSKGTQDKLNSSWDPYFIAGVISQYKLKRKK